MVPSLQTKMDRYFFPLLLGRCRYCREQKILPKIMVYCELKNNHLNYILIENNEAKIIIRVITVSLNFFECLQISKFLHFKII